MPLKLLSVIKLFCLIWMFFYRLNLIDYNWSPGSTHLRNHLNIYPWTNYSPSQHTVAKRSLAVAQTLNNLLTNHKCLQCKNKLLHTFAHGVQLWWVVNSHESCVDSVFRHIANSPKLIFPLQGLHSGCVYCQNNSTNNWNTDGKD